MRDFQLPGRSPVFATNGMCATSHPLAAKVAIELLESGGNAADAAIAAAVLLGLCEPHMAGLGGDCFVLLKPAGQEKIVALNGSGRAPKAADAEAMRAKGLTAMPDWGIDTVTMPGAVDAFCRLSDDWGHLGLEASLRPSIRYAEEGVPVGPRSAFDWAMRTRKLAGFARQAYLFDGEPPRLGQVFRAPGQAELLRQVAANGRAGFYEGEVADDLITSLQAAGGVHTLDDLAAVSCDWSDPVSGTYSGIELCEHPPNGRGATAILLLNILSHFNIATLDPYGVERAHLEAEATKLAYDASNRFLADPDHTTRLAHMLAPQTAARLAELIDPRRAMAAAAPLTEHVHKDTVYVTVVDKDRMAVSLIYSIYSAFGSGLCSSKHGVLFQNRGAGFNLIAGHPNELGGGKRPAHTIIPGMIREAGKVSTSFGVMGGAYQPCGHARFVSNRVDFGMGVQEAIDGPRSFSGPDGMQIERGYDDAVRAELVARGHDLRVAEKPLGGAQAINITADGLLIGGSDPRKDGLALGY
ncbi:gamma-glutamyltransferase family protein [Pseudophaeobacter arcticus]|jgi:gamma-glutamyltranspeptidase/glutathione hydrolase|uniref:gamma-glutamyltransferase family protein n=1 Tax=Pseudophaeobacter arcticus TaxID=385492 RepID=UPI0039E544E5